MSESFSVLVFTKTAAYRHESIPAAITAWKRLAQASQHPNSTSPAFTVEASEDASIFESVQLSRFRVIVFQHVSGEFLNSLQLDALKGFVRAGGGVVGIHTATTGMPSCDVGCVDKEGWYEKLIGGSFDVHPKPQDGIIRAESLSHPILTRGLLGQGDGLTTFQQPTVTRHWFDEWYNFKKPPQQNSNLNILLSVDERTYEGGTLGENHPIIWCQDFEGGRVFQTTLGHFDSAYEDEMFMGQVLSGLLWAAGLLQVLGA
ncbi:carboxylesterase-like protein [Metarhizium guizhouense ARSEF 977]|uniref:Carboxylesterase-like protein n=1 Tax=Metarhizium guizhouense (strain ARSEF 977) TaxID=1276136 RepID=A0A0B4HPS5_METGA|nr:carboxylesterase-like protein [Metarhizium guizhouense ARSEF 977]